ncbi:MAG: GPMC system family 4 glycosyltransferase [Geobacteraceae bacterium]
MKVVMIAPHYYPAVRGNAVTVRRIERCLAASGCRVRICSLDTMSAEAVMTEIRRYPPDLIHAFHAYTGGRIARLVADATRIPYIITLTGSDVYEALLDSRKTETLAALREAAALVAFHKSVKSRLLANLPLLAAKTAVIPQGVELPGDFFPYTKFPFSDGDFTFFLPAGLRPVKNILFPLEPLALLSKKYSMLRFLVAGPVLDPHYAATVLERLENYPFAFYLGGIGHDAIGALYKRADVVLNCSLFEGGMANSVLEAMALGRPVLASAIDGNQSLIKNGVTGFLYRDSADFADKAEKLILDEELRIRMGDNARRLVLVHHAPEKEADAYLRLYESVTA